MTTAAQLGFREPTGDDFVNTGDNDITHNAKKSAEMYDALILDAANKYGRDTKWRDVKALLPADVSALNFWIRRIGPRVLCSIQNLTSNVGGTQNVFTLPVGFRPDAPSIRAGSVSTDDTNAIRTVSPFGSTLRVLSMPPNTKFSGMVSFTTENTWPAEPYPGDQA